MSKSVTIGGLSMAATNHIQVTYAHSGFCLIARQYRVSLQGATADGRIWADLLPARSSIICKHDAATPFTIRLQTTRHLAAAFAATQKSIVLEEATACRPLEDFWPCRCMGRWMRSADWRCVASLTSICYGAPLTEPELASASRQGLTPRPKATLASAGHPYTEEFFRFHMTSTMP
ncbi:hypothetical protein FQR65_LT20540 [Abscondita terminalis]|nr:hypothetical protein FQR65_LT20540 [Abscondita terminalis]